MTDQKPYRRPFVPKPEFEREFERWALSADYSATGSCWGWKRNPGRARGVFMLRGKLMDAHRATWIIAHGDIPEGAQIHHTCENKRCVNPSHLKMLTAEQHAAEHPKLERFMLRRPAETCLKGHAFTPDNTIAAKNGKRKCKICYQAWAEARYRAKHPYVHRGEGKVTCKYGHPWVPENIYTKPSTGFKSCKECHRLEERARLARLREARKLSE